jgi:single-strand DNA-binding protein
MKSLNKVELIGFISNPEVMEMKNGSKLFKCSLATHENFKLRTGEWQSETTWHNIVIWNDFAKKAADELKKGARIHLTGKIVVDQFTDKEGKKRSAVKIQATEYEIAKDDDSSEA